MPLLLAIATGIVIHADHKPQSNLLHQCLSLDKQQPAQKGLPAADNWSWQTRTKLCWLRLGNQRRSSNHFPPRRLTIVQRSQRRVRTWKGRPAHSRRPWVGIGGFQGCFHTALGGRPIRWQEQSRLLGVNSLPAAFRSSHSQRGRSPLRGTARVLQFLLPVMDYQPMAQGPAVVGPAAGWSANGSTESYPVFHPWVIPPPGEARAVTDWRREIVGSLRTLFSGMVRDGLRLRSMGCSRCLWLTPTAPLCCPACAAPGRPGVQFAPTAGQSPLGPTAAYQGPARPPPLPPHHPPAPNSQPVQVPPGPVSAPTAYYDFGVLDVDRSLNNNLTTSLASYLSVRMQPPSLPAPTTVGFKSVVSVHSSHASEDLPATRQLSHSGWGPSMAPSIAAAAAVQPLGGWSRPAKDSNARAKSNGGTKTKGKTKSRPKKRPAPTVSASPGKRSKASKGGKGSKPSRSKAAKQMPSAKPTMPPSAAPGSSPPIGPQPATSTKVLKEGQCSVCDQILPSKTALTAHILEHCADEKIHCCHLCGRKFAREANWKLHVASHEEPSTPDPEADGKPKGRAPRKRFACTKCDKVFTQSGNLSRHRLVHTQEK